MKLGIVTGSVVSTIKDRGLVGLKLLVVEDCDLKGGRNGGKVVAVDAVGAGMGEVVLTTAGSSARQTPVTADRPVDAVITAIVDLIEAEGVITYRKGGEYVCEPRK